MKLTDILAEGFNPQEWIGKGYQLPQYDLKAVKEKTYAEPTWVHFGAGNIFRAFTAAVLNDVLNSGKYDRGIVVAETFDYEIIDKAYAPYENLSLLVSLKSTGDIEKKVIGSVTESLKADYGFENDWARLVSIFRNPSLQMISFTITEKGYGVAPHDLERGMKPVLAMGKVAVLLYERFLAGQLPLTVQSMDNCSHNGDKVKAGVLAYDRRSTITTPRIKPRFIGSILPVGRLNSIWTAMSCPRKKTYFLPAYHRIIRGSIIRLFENCRYSASIMKM